MATGVVISLQGDLDASGYKSLSALVEEVGSSGYGVRVLEQVLSRFQDGLVTDLCGPRYSRGSKPFKRCSTKERGFITSLGVARLRLVRVKDVRTGRSFSPLLVHFRVEPRKRVTRDLAYRCVDSARVMTYGDSGDDARKFTRASVSKSTIHRMVREVGCLFEGECRKPAGFVFADGTKTHSTCGRKNEVNVIISQNPSNGRQELVSVKVNEAWSSMGENLDTEGCLVVADGEKQIRHSLSKGRDAKFQICLKHVETEVSYKLWQHQAPKEGRKEILSKLKQILWTLVNSVKKHLEDGNTGMLRQRINETLKQLKKLAEQTRQQGYWRIDKFIRNSANHMITFAQLALKGIKAPWTNNLMERLMAEISKRVKHKWMHWSTQGLQNLLNILLTKYLNPQRYKKTWEKYINQTNKIKPIRSVANPST